MFWCAKEVETDYTGNRDRARQWHELLSAFSGWYVSAAPHSSTSDGGLHVTLVVNHQRYHIYVEAIKKSSSRLKDPVNYNGSKLIAIGLERPPTK